MQVTKRQHYVWRYYLKQWTDNIGKISCCRNGNVFSSDLTKIGVEKLFYQLIDISDYEASLVEALSIFSNLPNELKQMDKSWLDTYRLPFEYIKKFKELGFNDDKIFQKIIDETEENVYCTIEEIGKPFLEKLYKEDSTFYDNKDDKTDFNIYICEQFFRTKKRLEAIKSITTANINYGKIWGPMRHIFATNLAYNLTNRTDKIFKLFLLKNRTNINFITGDQPVINRYSTKENQGKPLDKFEFYYPITPRLSILLTENDYEDDELIINDDSKVYEFNDLIFVNSQEQIYATSQNELERYKEMTRD
jgi:hypothetical protein